MFAGHTTNKMPHHRILHIKKHPEELTEKVASDLLVNDLKEMTKIKYSFLKGLGKALLNVILFSIPLVIGQFPEAMNVTLGGVLVFVANWIKVRYKSI